MGQSFMFCQIGSFEFSNFHFGMSIVICQSSHEDTCTISVFQTFDMKCLECMGCFFLNILIIHFPEMDSLSHWYQGLSYNIATKS